MIGVIGLGFVGLTTALGFAESGIPTIGFDIDNSKLELIKSGKIPFYEPELREVLYKNLGKNFSLAKSINQLIESADIIFICVGTPKNIDGSADLSQVYSVIETIYKNVKETSEKIILIKSTVPPSTTDRMQELIYSENPNLEDKIAIGMNPEFLREGHAWEDFMNPDRIVVGINCSKDCHEKIKEIYKGFKKDIIFTSPRTAEFLKYLSNALLSTLISYSNEMSMLAKKIGKIDIAQAFRLLHLDKRFFGYPANIVSYIYPGCGYGGYCLPKDTEAIARMFLSLGLKPEILEANLSINSEIVDFLVRDFIKDYKDKSIKIGILGLAFKPNTDDVRETPAARFIKKLQEEGYLDIIAFDPMAIVNFRREYPELKISFAENANELVEISEVIFILTAWSDFAKINFENKRVFDLRYMLPSHTNL